MQIRLDPARVLARNGFFGAMIIWSIVNPAQMTALAEEPIRAAAATIDGLFPNLIDPKIFRRYDITFDESVSDEVKSTSTIRKISGGHASEVMVTTTPSGTYSTDGLLSPFVRYPGIDKRLKSWARPRASYGYSSGSTAYGHWSSYTSGSFTYYSYRASTRI